MLRYLSMEVGVLTALAKVHSCTYRRQVTAREYLNIIAHAVHRILISASSRHYVSAQKHGRLSCVSRGTPTRPTQQTV